MISIKPFKAVLPKLGIIPSPDSFFDQVKEQYNTFFQAGYFNEAKKKAIYIYRVSDALHMYTGLIAQIPIESYLDNSILKHEQTLKAKEAYMMELMLERQAQIKPVMLTYPKVNSINKFLKDFTKKSKPKFSVYYKLAEHSFWEIKEKSQIKKLQKLFEEKVPKAYIADGHHRAETMANYHTSANKNDKANSNLLCAMFPSDELVIHDFNRVISTLNGDSPTRFIAKISSVFKIEMLSKVERPKKQYELSMFLKGEWYKLTWRKEVLKKYKKLNEHLDANLLNEEVLKGILGIEDIRNNQHIRYVEGPKGLLSLAAKVGNSQERVAFCLSPIKFEEFISIADANEVLPPKSTYFEPRIRNGFIGCRLNS